MRHLAASAVLLLALPAALAGCGGSSSSETTTPASVCTQMTNIAGTLKNLSTGLASGQASIDAITSTTSQLKQEFALLNESLTGIDDPKVAPLQESFRQFRLAYNRLPPGTTPKEAQSALKQPVADVKSSYVALLDSLACPTPPKS